MRILIFGDSITEGFCDYEMGGWVNMLKIYFWKKGAKFRVTNLGISGDNSEDILKRFESFQKAYNHKYQNKSIIIFSFGMNDSLLLKNGNNDINIDEFKKNIGKLIQISKDNSLISKIIFLTNTNIDELKTNLASGEEIFYKNNEIKKYNQVIKNISKKYGLEYIDLFGIILETDLLDGLHPNTLGHKKIFEKVKSYLENNF